MSTTATKGKPEKKQHIQVFTRVRPINTQELRSQVVVECVNGKEVSVRDKSQTKTFTFDKVFGPDSKQVDVYKAVVSPLIAEVLQGYNCTVFAYGQTGTGKTFTMVGEKTQGVTTWEEDPNCGIIPRTLSHLFDELKVRAEEFTVRVSFLELYNEELFDLLAPNDSEDGKSLKLFEDSMKKGSVIVSGLEERTVHTKNDVYAILEAGNLRRQTAPTLMNAQSSRSHTIFTITVHIKVTTPEGEDLIKTGKLNLVDLAGSENIGRSGAVDLRAREAGNINQSLLTLGRVITSLVERTPHIPYRESKLTRLLQDSLGGRTKTSIIATVSPALCNIDETLSTFDYAHRARNITNKPEINQKTSKRVLLKEYTEEIERLRRDLIAAREKHGVYLASENYNAIMAEKENLNKELVAKLQMLKLREDELAKQEEIMKCLNMDLYTTQSELAATSQKLQEAEKLCSQREDMFIKLSEQTNVLLQTADEAVNDTKSLHDRLEKSRRILEHNLNLTGKFKVKFCSSLSVIKNRTQDFLEKGVCEVESQNEDHNNFIKSVMAHEVAIKNITEQIVNKTNTQVQATNDLFAEQARASQNFLTQQLTILKSTIDGQNSNAHHIISDLLEYSKMMKINWENILISIEESEKELQQQCPKIKEVQQKIEELTNSINAVTKLFYSRIEEQEKSLKYYKDKCDSLIKTRTCLKNNKLKLLEDFYLGLKKILEEDDKIDECMKNALDEEKGQERKFYSDISKGLGKNSENLDEAAKTALALLKKIAEDNGLVIKKSNDLIIPQLIQMADTKDKWTGQIEKSLEENAKNLENQLNDLMRRCEHESQSMNESSKNIGQKCAETLGTMTDFGARVNESIEREIKKLESALQDLLTKKNILSNKIRDHSEELFSSIHDRIKEIETVFSKEFKMDEKTGTTPQRKEFNYPRRIISFTNRNINTAEGLDDEF